MAEYIEREALLLQIDLHGTNKFGMLDEDIREFVKKQPTADVAEVRHGEWSNTDWQGVAINGYMVCTQCNVMIPKCEYNRYCMSYLRYCPNCGAKMDGKGD